MSPRWALLGAVLFACSANPAPPLRPVSTDPADEHYQSPTLPRGVAVLEDAYGGKHRVSVEVAADNASRTRGLMWRTALPEGTGMLFIFPHEMVHSFWMRNTLIPLDMLFINKAGRVVGIVQNAEPKTLVSRGVREPSTYVLEVPGGWTQKQGIVAGSRVVLEGMDAIRPTP